MRTLKIDGQLNNGEGPGSIFQDVLKLRNTPVFN